MKITEVKKIYYCEDRAILGNYPTGLILELQDGRFMAEYSTDTIQNYAEIDKSKLGIESPEPSVSAEEYGNMYGCYDANSKKTELYHSLEGAMYWHEKDPNRYFVSVYTEDVIRSHGGPENFLKALNVEPKSTESSTTADQLLTNIRKSDWFQNELKKMHQEPSESKDMEEIRKACENKLPMNDPWSRGFNACLDHLIAKLDEIKK